MFRRKEDSLFDSENDTDTTTDSGATSASGNASGGGSSSSSSSATPAAAPATATASSTPSTSSSSAPAGFNQPTSRPLPEARPSAPPTANAFRPNAAPIGSDMARNRMPEAKSPLPAPSSNAEKNSKVGRRVLTVGNDILLKGEIATCDRLVIEGKVDATLNEVHTVEIAETGSFKGSAHIEDAEISGLFEGDLVVRNRLVIYGTGKVRGKISYGEIEIERGGEISGEIKATNNQPTSAARPAARTTTPAKDDKVAA